MDMRIVEIKEQDFPRKIEVGLYLVEFSAPWCLQTETRSFFEKEMPDRFRVGFLLCDVDKNPNISSKLGIFSLPTWVFFYDGHEVDRFVGHEAKKNFIACINHFSLGQPPTG